jgi:mannose-6-phosphate isomerase
MGTHPVAPSQLEVDGRLVTLGDFIDARPRHSLGPVTGDSFPRELATARLPFMMKLLAANSSLSLQVHPTRAQAEQGFEREDASGLPVDHPMRSFRDQCHKPEMLYALSPFDLLAGFREPQEIQATLLALAELAGGPHATSVLAPLRATLDALEHPVPGVALRGAFGALLTTSPGPAAELVTRVVAAAAQRPDAGPDSGLVVRLASEHPGDVGALAALFLVRHHLEPGQALFVDAGVVHSYLEGLGVEVMSTSDNVLRAGLTSKHVSVPDVLSTVRFVPGGVGPLLGVPSFGGVRFAPAVRDFSLWVRDGHSGQTGGMTVAGPPSGPRIVLSCGAPVTVLTDSHEVTLPPGASAFVPHADGPIRLESSGRVAVALPG